MQQAIINISNDFRKLCTRIGQGEQANNQQLESVSLGYSNLEDILETCFSAIKYNLD